MEPKKISFGFSKIDRKLPIIVLNKIAQKPATNKVELIKCLEGQEIKLVEEKPEEAPLVIPLKENQKTSAALTSLMKRRAVLLDEDEPMELSTPTEKPTIIINETDDIETRAARELLAELNAQSAEKFTSELVLPVVHPDDLPLEGAKESSLYDYDDIPVDQFGKAMLRGMGWVEPSKPEKGGLPLDDSPMVRPKGMGLGADKALKTKPLLVAPESNEVLQVKRNAFVRILGGKHKDLYGQIEGFDDHAGRVIVKMAIGGFKEAFNEFLCQPVAKKEFAQYGKCINSTKYDEYKKKENEHGQIILKKEEIAEIDKRSIKYEKIKRKTQDISSDEDCKIVEKKALRPEASAGSREKTNYYDDRDIKNERNYKKDYKREDAGERSRARYKDEDGFTKRENTKDYERDSKRDDFKEVEGNRERNKNHQKDSYAQSRNKDSERNRERSCDKYESKYTNDEVERRRSSNKDNVRDQREHCRDKHYDERKSRQTKVSNPDESDNDDGKKYKKSSKDKKTKRKSKKSKKYKSKHHESSDAESTSSSCSDSSESENERRKKYKKKTKKSKKERERSRSRGRR